VTSFGFLPVKSACVDVQALDRHRLQARRDGLADLVPFPFASVSGARLSKHRKNWLVSQKKSIVLFF
jgi:hypothetical protein